MDKYIALIEYLKEDYMEHSESLYYRLGKRCQHYPDPSKLSFYIAKSEEYNEKDTCAITYKIISKDYRESWNVIVCHATALFAVRMRTFRDKLLNEHTIQGIITLKSGFFQRTLLPTAIIVLDKGASRTWLTSCSNTNEVIEAFRNINQYSKKVFYTEELDSKDFTPEHYNQATHRINAVLECYESRRLEDIADIVIGKGIMSYQLSNQGIPYLRARDLKKDGTIGNTEIFVPEELARKYPRYLLQEGDILLSKNFGQHKISRVTLDDLPAFVSNAIIIIRVFGVPEDYLYQYLTSETGKKVFDQQLSSIERGITDSINLRDLKELRVPIYDQLTMDGISQIDSIRWNSLAYDLLAVAVNRRFDAIPIEAFVSTYLSDKVYKALLENGWKKQEVFYAAVYKEREAISAKDFDYYPSIILLNDNRRLAFIEAKSYSMMASPGWAEMVYKIIQSGQIPLFILTNGEYYEIHSAQNKMVKKMTTVPTKEQLLSMLLEEEVSWS